MECPYCNTIITQESGLWAARELSDHKISCPQKRYLGGELTIERWDPETGEP